MPLPAEWIQQHLVVVVLGVPLLTVHQTLYTTAENTVYSINHQRSFVVFNLVMVIFPFRTGFVWIITPILQGWFTGTWAINRVHDDVIKWKHFPRYRPFVRGIHRSPVNSPHKGQWRGALMFTLICARINGWVYNHEADDLRRHHAHYDVIVMDYPSANEVIIKDMSNICHYLTTSDPFFSNVV